MLKDKNIYCQDGKLNDFIIIDGLKDIENFLKYQIKKLNIEIVYIIFQAKNTGVIIFAIDSMIYLFF